MTVEERLPRRTGTFVTLVLLATLALAGFLALGFWQVHRLAWKEALIAQVERQAHMPPQAAPAPADWPTLKRAHDEYAHLRVQGHYLADHDTLVRAATELGSGYWVLTPLKTAQGYWVLVNRGFVPPEWRTQVPAQMVDSEFTTTVTGLLRFTEPKGSLLQDNDPTQDRWYSRDVAAIAAHQGLRGPVAPYFLDATEAAPGQRWPRAGLTRLHFSNNHLVYAVTWFALAAMMACAIGYLVIDERRLRRLAGERAHGLARH